MAARWHLAQANDDMDWTAFTEWLEADPRHREAYDAIALLDARIDAARPMLSRLLATDSERRAHRVPWAWTAIAAVFVAAIAIGIGLMDTRPGRMPDTAAYRTPIGQPRDLRLADGSVAMLAPGSVLRVSPSRDVAMTLDGKAFFDVRHDPVHPLVVRAGGYEIRDVGTRFEISTSDGMVRIAVAEGRVMVRSPKATGEIEVTAGKALTLAGSTGAAEMRPARSESIGAWRRGALVYDDVPLALVVADIARSTGHPVTVDRIAARRGFSGVIAPGSREAMVGALSEMTGLKTRTDGDAILIGGNAGR